MGRAWQNMGKAKEHGMAEGVHQQPGVTLRSCLYIHTYIRTDESSGAFFSDSQPLRFQGGELNAVLRSTNQPN